MSSHRKRTTEEDDLEEIRKGFEKFDVNGTGIINPAELLEAMDAMNIKEKNPFIYEIIESLNSEKEIRKKGGVELEELVTYVYNKVNDTETNIGLRQIHEVINDKDTDTIPMTTFYDLARNYGDQLTEDEIRTLLEKTQMGGTNLTFDEFYTIMKGAGKENSSMNMSRSSYRNKNNNEVYVKKGNNPNLNENNNNKVRAKKFIYKKEVEPEKEKNKEEPEQKKEVPEQTNEILNKNEEEPEQNKEIEYEIEIERRFYSPKQNEVVEYHVEQQIEEPINQDNELDNNININLEEQQQNQNENKEEEYQYNPINEEINQKEYYNISREDYPKDYDPNINAYSKDNNELLSSPRILNPNDMNESQNMNESSEIQHKNENSEIDIDNPRNSEPQSETSSQLKYSYRKRKIGAASIKDKSDNNINLNDNENKITKEKETKITNLPDGGKQIEITEKTEVVKEKPYVRGHRYRFGRYKNEENENVGNNNEDKKEEKKEEKKEDKKSYYRIRKPFNNQREGGQVTMTKVNVEENNEVNIPKRYHRRYRESKATSFNNNNQ